MAFVIIALEVSGAVVLLAALKNETPAALLRSWLSALKSAPSAAGGGGGGGPKTR